MVLQRCGERKEWDRVTGVVRHGVAEGWQERSGGTGRLVLWLETTVTAT